MRIDLLRDWDQNRNPRRHHGRIVAGSPLHPLGCYLPRSLKETEGRVRIHRGMNINYDLPETGLNVPNLTTICFSLRHLNCKQWRSSNAEDEET